MLVMSLADGYFEACREFHREFDSSLISSLEGCFLLC